MKKLILIMALGFAVTNTFADTTAISGSASIATTDSTSNANASVAGSGNSDQSQKQKQKQRQRQDQEQSVQQSGNSTVGCLINCADTSSAAKAAGDAEISVALINGQTARDVSGRTQRIENTPSVNGPQLVTSNDTCMGSTSGSVNAPGIGVGFGTSWVDGNCKMLKNSRELWNMGMKAAALALMCTDSINREALELTGFECPQTTRDKKGAVKVSESIQPEVTDPIIRARLGLDATVATK